MKKTNLFFYTDSNKGEVDKFYLEANGIPADDWYFITAVNGNNGKPPAKKVVRAELEEFFQLPSSQDLELIVTNNSAYFKELAGVTKTEAYIGSIRESNQKYGRFKVVYVPAIGSVLYSPNKYNVLLEVGIETIQKALQDKDTDVSKFLEGKKYFRPTTYKGIKKALERLARVTTPLAIDVEAFSLKHPTAGLGTIGFALDENTSIAIPVDHTDSVTGNRRHNGKIRALLKEFFIKTKNQKHIYHNISYDAKVIIYSLFMDSIDDRKGLLEGMEYVLHNWEDTQIISYLCFNSTDRPDLSLKFQALSFAGNWAELVGDDIKDISKVDNEKLCYYNAIDCNATWYVYNKNYPLMVEENQEHLYHNLFKPTQEVLIKAMMTGICIDMDRVLVVEKELTEVLETMTNKMNNFDGVAEFNEMLRKEQLHKDNLKRKTPKGMETIKDWLFNPGSDNHIRTFMYDILKIPPEHFTDTGKPATNDKAITTALASPSVSDKAKEFLTYLSEYNKVAILTSTFIPAFKGAFLARDGEYYVYGNYNITGTVSMRLSSNDPNLQNIPAHGEYGAMIKSCVKAPEGYALIGLDADSLILATL